MHSVHSWPYVSEPQSLLAECAMCKSDQPCYEGESSRMPVDQLRRIVWVLIVWVSLLTLCLGVSIMLHFIPPHEHTQVPILPSVNAGTGCNLITYDFTGDFNLTSLQFESKESDKITVNEDANYFIYLRLTLESQTPGMNYSINVTKAVNKGKEENIMEGHINRSQTLTLFMAKGLRLISDTVLKVVCTPNATISTVNTYLGVIKLGPSGPCVPPPS